MPSPRPRITAALIARDEAANLPGCLASLGWADEVVIVVDAESRDATRAIAQRRADVVTIRRFDDFAAQRNAAIDRATGDWIFSIDADERASKALAAEIRQTVASAPPEVAGFRVPIRSVILGRPFGFSGTQDDRPIRLFRRGAGRWTGKVHEVVALRGRCGALVSPLWHRTLPDLPSFRRKIEVYTTLEAEQFARDGRPARRLDHLIRPLWTFARLYVGKEGYRDGREGLLFCALSAHSVTVRDRKHRAILDGRRVA